MLKLLFFLGIFALANAQLSRVRLYKNENLKSLGNVRAERNMLIKKYSKEPINADRECVEELDNSINTPFYGNISMGTPPQYFKVLFDTSKPYLWIPLATACTNSSKTCQPSYGFNGSLSTTYVPVGESIESLTSDEYLEGVLEQDVLGVAGLTVPNQVFATEAGLEQSQASFGLGFKTLSWNHYLPPIYNMLRNKVIQEPIFSVYLSRNASANYGGEIIFGGIDPTYYKGDITYVNVTDDTQWSFQIANVSILGKNYGTNVTAVIDSSTSFISIPIKPYAFINEYMNATADNEGNYFVDCSTVPNLPNVDFTVNGVVLSITPADYILNITGQDGSIQCLSSFTFSGSAEWILGDAFYGAFYTVFNFDQRDIGFATMVQQSPPQNSAGSKPRPLIPLPKRVCNF